MAPITRMWPAEAQHNGGGLWCRLFAPLMRMIGSSWHMYPLGVLFGLGFDTATEVGILGIAALEAGKGLPVYTIMVFPLLFTAGMCLLDTTDGVLMLGCYGWAFVKPVRKLYYNLNITLVSVLVAVLVGHDRAAEHRRPAARLSAARSGMRSRA